MRIKRLTQPDEKSGFQKYFEYTLMAVVLAIIACRCTHTESLTSSGMSILVDYISLSQSLTFSVSIFAVALIWFVVNLIRGEFAFRISGFSPGFVIFTVGAGLATFAASDSRASICSYLTIASAVVTGIFMVQVLKRFSLIRLTAIIIAALAVVNCYESFNQLLTSNEYMLEQYEQDPESQLSKIGIESGTLEAFLYEHRLRSKDIKGYFTTGNSLGSFLILTGFTTIGIFAGKLRYNSDKKKNPVDMAIIAFILLMQVGCFFAAASKGAALAAMLGLAMLLIWLFFRQQVIAHRYKLFIAAVVIGSLAVGFITIFAAATRNIPGGNSFLVRGEYWAAAARMIMNNLFTGVGGGNFGYHYTLYKLPASIETVLDPHNMLLSVAAQYGIIGLAGFALLLFLPLTKIIFPKIKLETGSQQQNAVKQQNRQASPKLIYSIALFITVVLFIVRPFVIPVESSDNTSVMVYVLIVMYAAPALIFLFTVWILDKAIDNELDFQYLQASIFCGIIAMLAHNLIDFAIFEPGVMSMLFLAGAVFVSITKDRLNRFGWRIRIDRSDAIVVSTLATAAFAVVLLLGYIPVVCSTLRLEKAFWGKRLKVHQLVEAASCDPFGCKIEPFIAKVLWSEYDPQQNSDNLVLAEKYFSMAIKKNPANFKNYKNLGRLRRDMADNTETYRRKTLLTGAEDAYRMAIARYPADAELHLELGKVMFQQDKPQEANEEFAAALKIERKFRERFKRMYPDQEVVSRIDPKDYEFLKGVVVNDNAE